MIERDDGAWLAEWLECCINASERELAEDATRLHAAMRAGFAAHREALGDDGFGPRASSDAVTAGFRAVRESLEGE